MKPTTPIDLAHAALVLIDLQKGIVPLSLAPHAGPDVVRNAALLAERFRAAGAPVVLVNVNFSPDGADALRQEVDNPRVPGQMPADWAEIVPEIGPRPGDLRITKRQWGAFHGTELDLQLRRRGVTKIVLGGIATNIGVESTARTAHELGYSLVFAEDAMSSRSEEMHLFSVRQILPLIGLVRSTAEVLAACSGGGK